ncbi:MAG TPA: pyrroline-5-carboxylate reductase [Alphaproteobacteria bacterium]|nr:pyrroline-5-carboxylate reductase [Alphaproteobacteria bacterium]
MGARGSRAPNGAECRLLLVGCGRMGSALLDGWLASGIAAADVVVVEPAAGGALPEPSPRFVAEPAAIARDFAPTVVIFAVKPQTMDETAPLYARYAGAGTVFLSIAAGKTIGFFQAALGEAAAIVRSMPNTPAAIGRGISVACANGHVSADQRALCGELLSAVGDVAWVEDEALLDAVTAVSGSGPAYVFLLTEAMATAGVAAGLPQPLAVQLARATVAGAGELMRQSGEDASQLRVNVTSPGGTTQAALDVLMADGDGLAALMSRAVGAATRRSRELAG